MQAVASVRMLYCPAPHTWQIGSLYVLVARAVPAGHAFSQVLSNKYLLVESVLQVQYLSAEILPPAVPLNIESELPM